MLDPDFVLKNPEIVASGAARKGIPVDLGKVERLSRERRLLARRRTELGRRIRELGARTTSPLDRSLARRLREEASAVANELKITEEGLRRAALRLPNLPDEDAPDSAAGPRPGEKKPKGLHPPDWDEKSGKRASGRGSVIWRGRAAEREEELVRLILDAFTGKGYGLVAGGPVVTREALEWAGFLPYWENRLGTLAEGLFLAPRPEALLSALHAGETILPASLPRAYVSAGWCYRPHGTSHGSRPVRPVQYRAVDILRIEKPGRGLDALGEMVREVVAVHGDLGLKTVQVARPASKLSFSAARSVDILASGGGGVRLCTCTVSGYGDFLSRRAGTRLRGGGHPETLSAALGVPKLMALLILQH